MVIWGVVYDCFAHMKDFEVKASKWRLFPAPFGMPKLLGICRERLVFQWIAGNFYRNAPFNEWENRWFPVSIFPETNPLSLMLGTFGLDHPRDAAMVSPGVPDHRWWWITSKTVDMIHVDGWSSRLCHVIHVCQCL